MIPLNTQYSLKVKVTVNARNYILEQINRSVSLFLRSAELIKDRRTDSYSSFAHRMDSLRFMPDVLDRFRYVQELKKLCSKHLHIHSLFIWATATSKSLLKRTFCILLKLQGCKRSTANTVTVLSDILDMGVGMLCQILIRITKSVD